MVKDALCLIIQSKTKRKLLKLFLLNKNKKFHVRELSRLVDEPLSAIQRELKKLLDMELITKVPEKGVINYYVNTELGYFNDLKNVVLKLGSSLKEYFRILTKSELISAVWAIGKTAENPKSLSAEIEVVIVGTMAADLVDNYIHAIEDLFGRKIRYHYFATYDQVPPELNTHKKVIIA